MKISTNENRNGVTVAAIWKSPGRLNEGEGGGVGEKEGKEIFFPDAAGPLPSRALLTCHS